MRYLLVVVLVIFILTAVGCTSPDRTRETLQKSGFTEIETGGYDAWACADSDTYSTHFRARNPQGAVVEGTVCCGMWKSCTVRF